MNEIANAKEILKMAQQAAKITPGRWADLMELMKDDPAMNRRMKEQWFSKPRDSEAAVREYYRSSDIWFVNTFNHGHAALEAMASPYYKAAVEPCHILFPFTNDFQLSGWLLDYGGGLWKDTHLLVAMGYRVAQAEVRGPVTELLKMYIANYKLRDRMAVVEVDGDAPLVEKYDGILCFETLEHLKEPIPFLSHLVQHLNPGQPLAYSASFGAPEHAPYHVAENAHLSNKDTWAGLMNAAGLRPHWKAADGHREIWKRRRD